MVTRNRFSGHCLFLVTASRMRACACDTASRLCVRTVLCRSAFSLAPPLRSTGSAAAKAALFWQALRDSFEVRSVGSVLEQNLSDPARDAAAPAEFQEKAVADLQHRRMRRAVAQSRRFVQPCCVQDDLCRGLLDEPGTTHQLLRQPGFRNGTGHGDPGRRERRSHHVTHQGDMDTDPQLSDELVEGGIDPRMRERRDRPGYALSLFLEDDVRQRCRQLVIFDGELIVVRKSVLQSIA